MTDELVITLLNSPTGLVVILRFGAESGLQRGGGGQGENSGPEKWGGGELNEVHRMSTSARASQLGSKEKQIRCHCVFLSSPLPLPPGSLEHRAVRSSGMEPDTVLWSSGLQGPEQSPSDAHRGEGHQKGLQS